MQADEVAGVLGEQSEAALRGLHRLEQARALHGDADLVADRRQEAEVVVAEAPVAALRVQHAEHLAVGHDRHRHLAHDRLGRAQEVDVAGHVVHERGRAGGRDAPGDPHPHREHLVDLGVPDGVAQAERVAVAQEGAHERHAEGLGDRLDGQAQHLVELAAAGDRLPQPVEQLELVRLPVGGLVQVPVRRRLARGPRPLPQPTQDQRDLVPEGLGGAARGRVEGVGVGLGVEPEGRDDLAVEDHRHRHGRADAPDVAGLAQRAVALDGQDLGVAPIRVADDDGAAVRGDVGEDVDLLEGEAAQRLEVEADRRHEPIPPVGLVAHDDAPRLRAGDHGHRLRQHEAEGGLLGGAAQQRARDLEQRFDLSGHQDRERRTGSAPSAYHRLRAPTSAVRFARRAAGADDATRRCRRCPIPPKIDPDDWHAADERPKRKARRTPKGRQNVTTLLDEQGMAAPGTALARLQERGYVQEIVGELKSGKEGTVYLGRTPVGPAAVKIYRDAEVRSFKNDQRYLEGRWVGDARLAKAIKRRSGAGRLALKAMWAAQEYLVLWKAWNAGLPVPEPLVGPDQSDIAEAGEVVLMRFVGDPDAPAPRLSDAVLDAAEAADAFAQSVAAMRGLWRIGLVHGDFSTYNLLWWQGRVIVIDLPQAMGADQPGARDVLAPGRRLAGPHLRAPGRRGRRGRRRAAGDGGRLSAPAAQPAGRFLGIDSVAHPLPAWCFASSTI